MKYKIVGINRIIRYGKSPKNGAHLHMLYNDDNTEGQSVKKAWLNDGAYAIDNIEIGKTYDFEIYGYFIRKIKTVNDTKTQ